MGVREKTYSNAAPEHAQALMYNRAFFYGDGFFETMRLRGGKLLWADYHERRFFRSLEALQMSLPLLPGQDFRTWLLAPFRSDLQQAEHWRLRLTVYRSGEGLYSPRNCQSLCYWHLQELPSGYALWPEQACYQAGIHPDIRRPSHDAYTAYKTCSALPFVLAGQYKVQEGFDELLLLNSSGNVAEASAANIFALFPNKCWRTPALKQGCINGIMRQLLLDMLPQWGYRVEEGELSLEELMQAEELLCASSIVGLRPIHRLGSQSYAQTHTRALQQHLIDLSGS